MKIRNDFVTNSSSSSFTVTIDIELKNGETLSLSMYGSEECGDYRIVEVDNDKLKANKFGKSPNIDSLINLIDQCIDYESFDEEEGYYYNYDKSGTPISENSIEEDFFNGLKSIEMKDIKKISIEQSKFYHDGDEWGHYQSYDCETGEFKYQDYEEPPEDQG